MDAERIARFRLARAEGVGPVTFRRLLDRFGSGQRAVAQLPELARSVGRSGVKLPPLDAIERELEQLRRLNADLLLWGDPLYPSLLAHLDSAPVALSLLGDIAALQPTGVAIVGGRNASTNGRRIAETLASGLAEAGFCVVSGLARGVDAAAHRGAMAQGRTIAAVAGGLDEPYPPENVALQQEIVARGGLIVAEAPLGVKPQNRHFPRRNRIIAGLSLGCVVIEAARHSGSLITARLALEAGRELYAIPGSPLDPRNAGSNDLIRQGAYLTETVADIVENLPPQPKDPATLSLPLFAEPLPARAAPPVAPPGSDADLGTRIQAMLSPESIDVDWLIRELAAPVSAVMAALSDLEMMGDLEMLPGNRVMALGR